MYYKDTELDKPIRLIIKTTSWYDIYSYISR